MGERARADVMSLVRWVEGTLRIGGSAVLVPAGAALGRDVRIEGSDCVRATANQLG